MGGGVVCSSGSACLLLLPVLDKMSLSGGHSPALLFRGFGQRQCVAMVCHGVPLLKQQTCGFAVVLRMPLPAGTPPSGVQRAPLTVQPTEHVGTLMSSPGIRERSAVGMLMRLINHPGGCLKCQPTSGPLFRDSISQVSGRTLEIFNFNIFPRDSD